MICHVSVMCFFPWWCCVSPILLFTAAFLAHSCLCRCSLSVSEQILDPQHAVDKEKHIFRNEASLVEIQGYRSGLAGLWLPEAQLRHWLAQFLRDLFLQFMVRCVQRDRQSHSVCVVDLHHHRARLCTLSCATVLGRSRNTSTDIDIEIWKYWSGFWITY